MTDKQIIIKDCPYFIGGCCQEYLDGVCENHKCDLKIIRELEEKLSNKRKECDELHETVKSQKEEIKNLNYTLYEERNLTTDLAKANLKISALERDLSSIRNRFKNENQQNKEIIKAKEQECERLKNERTLDLVKQLDQLKAENDELKKWKETVVELFERTCRCKYLNEENNHCGFYNRKCIGRLNQCLYKNQQTLIEIKKIAEKIDDSSGCAYGDYDCDNCSSLEQETVCTYKVKKIILQKISEVEDEQ